MLFNIAIMEFLEYEKAINRYYSQMSIKSLPLVCWDIFSQKILNNQALVQDHSKLVKLESKYNWNTTWNYNHILAKDTVIVVTDAQLSIVFASDNINAMNGYYPEEVIGKTPKMFQGKDTDAKTSNEIKQAILKKQSFNKVVLNYRKDGSIYKCRIHGHPIFNKKGVLTNFIAFEQIAA